MVMQFLADAAIIAATPRVGVGHLIGRHRGRRDTADKLVSLRVQRRGQVAILVRLRGRQFQALVFRLEAGNLILRQEVQNGAAVGVGIVDNVTGAVLDGVARITSLRCHIVVHAVNSALGIAAALSHLSAQAVKALLGLITQGTNGIVHAVEAVAHRVTDGGLAVLEAIQGKAFIDVCAGSIALKTGAIHAVPAAEAAIAAPAEHTENQEQDYPRDHSPPHMPPLPLPYAGCTGIVKVASLERDIFFTPYFIFQNRGHGF